MNNEKETKEPKMYHLQEESATQRNDFKNEIELDDDTVVDSDTSEEGDITPEEIVKSIAKKHRKLNSKKLSQKTDFDDFLNIEQLIIKFLIHVQNDSSHIDSVKYGLNAQDLNYIRSFKVYNRDFGKECVFVDPERIAYSISKLKSNKEICRKLYHLTFSSWPEEDLEELLNKYN